MGLYDRIKPYLGDKHFYKQVAAIALPISAQSLITIGVNMTDTVMLGKLGETALSASALLHGYRHGSFCVDFPVLGHAG